MQAALLHSSTIRPLVGSSRATPLRAAAPSSVRPALGRRVTRVSASGKPQDFDEFLQFTADKFEAVDNKPVVIGYLVAAIFAVFTAEWFIHLPLFNALLGFPIQLLGLVLTPYLAIRYYVDKDGDMYDDAEALVGKIVKQLPGLGK